MNEEMQKIIKSFLKDNGYKINVVFVATDDPIKNVLYVTQRYLKNGHEVPISKIINKLLFNVISIFFILMPNILIYQMMFYHYPSSNLQNTLNE